LIGLGGRQVDQLIWPILLIGIGAYFIIRRGLTSFRYRPDNEDENGDEESHRALDSETAEAPKSDN